MVLGLLRRLGNTNRAVFAEFLFGSALGVTDRSRVEWDVTDLRYRDKDFDIKERLGRYAESNTYASEAGRAADCYVNGPSQS